MRKKENVEKPAIELKLLPRKKRCQEVTNERAQLERFFPGEYPMDITIKHPGRDAPVMDPLEKLIVRIEPQGIFSKPCQG